MGVQVIENGFRWGDDGVEWAYRPESAGSVAKAFEHAVAEGLARGELMEAVAERAVARELSGKIGITKDAGGGLIVAYWLDGELAQALAALGSVSAEELHLTILYLGKLDEAEFDVDAIAAVTKLFTMERGPIEASITGLGRFVGDDSTDILVALVDSPDLAAYRHALCDELCWRGALPYESEVFAPQHGFIPHVTLQYAQAGFGEAPPSLPEVIPFTIDSLSIAAGGQRATYPFRTDLVEEEARVYEPAYKAGRVLSSANLKRLEEAMAVLAEVADSERKRFTDPTEAEEESTESATEKAGGAPVVVEAPLTYLVEKASEEKRYTMGPLYVPDRQDAHGDYTDAETLQEALWGYVEASAENGRRLNLQHNTSGEVTVGTWVEAMAWPYEHEIELTVPGQETRKVSMPAGTVYMGIKWDEGAWPLVKAGKLKGLSLGGRAFVVPTPGVQLEDMGG